MKKNKIINVLHLHVDYKWYDMVKDGIKKEEYRLDTPYWVKRLTQLKVGLLYFSHRNKYEEIPFKHYDAVMYYRGYSKDTMLLKCDGISLGVGVKDWGAPDGKDVFKIKLGKETSMEELLIEHLGDELCKHCPWYNNDIDKARISTCEGLYCDEALDNYKYGN